MRSLGKARAPDLRVPPDPRGELVAVQGLGAAPAAGEGPQTRPRMSLQRLCPQTGPGSGHWRLAQVIGAQLERER